MSPQLQMLNRIMDYLIAYENKTKEESFEALLRFIANQLDFEDLVDTPWVKDETFSFVKANLNLEVLRQDPWDWLGDLHHTRKLKLIQGDYYIDRKEIETKTKEVASGIKKSKLKSFHPYSMLDSCAATGQGLLEMSKYLPANSVLYGVEMDKTAYQIAVVNMKLYGVFSVILHANEKLHDIRSDSPNWRYANLFAGVKQTRLLTEEETNELR